MANKKLQGLWHNQMYSNSGNVWILLTTLKKVVSSQFKTRVQKPYTIWPKWPKLMPYLWPKMAEMREYPPLPRLHCLPMQTGEVTKLEWFLYNNYKMLCKAAKKKSFSIFVPTTSWQYFYFPTSCKIQAWFCATQSHTITGDAGPR